MPSSRSTERVPGSTGDLSLPRSRALSSTRIWSGTSNAAIIAFSSVARTTACSSERSIWAISSAEAFIAPFLAIRAPFAREGNMTEALQLMLRYAFDGLKLHRLEANIQPGNVASIALAQRAGFQNEGFSRG